MTVASQTSLGCRRRGLTGLTHFGLGLTRGGGPDETKTECSRAERRERHNVNVTWIMTASNVTRDNNKCEQVVRREEQE